MPKAKCMRCGNAFSWRWEEAFEKFGFGDGDGQIYTSEVDDILRLAGYGTSLFQWGCHNFIITSVTKDGVELIPAGTKVGYDDPRRYLPRDIVALLDRRLGLNAEIGK